MMKAAVLTVQALERESFAPFGDVIETEAAARHFSINEGNTERYHDLARIDPGAEGRAIVSIFRGLPRALPFEISMMERHPRASQAFVPLSGRPYLVAVAPAGPAPRLEDIRVYACRGSQGVNYAAGVWHHPLMALDDVSDFLVIDRDGPGENCDVVQLERTGLITKPEVQAALGGA
nr:ureidoglycolate lyase [Candidimonas nitroreducens]